MAGVLAVAISGGACDMAGSFQMVRKKRCLPCGAHILKNFRLPPASLFFLFQTLIPCLSLLRGFSLAPQCRCNGERKNYTSPWSSPLRSLDLAPSVSSRSSFLCFLLCEWRAREKVARKEETSGSLGAKNLPGASQTSYHKRDKCQYRHRMRILSQTDLLHDALLIIVAKGTAQLVIVHGWPVLLETPQPGHLQDKTPRCINVCEL